MSTKRLKSVSNGVGKVEWKKGEAPALVDNVAGRRPGDEVSVLKLVYPFDSNYMDLLSQFDAQEVKS